MRVAKAMSVLVATCLALTSGTATASAGRGGAPPWASTAEKDAKAPAAPVSANGIGQRITPRVDTGLYSAPGLSTPRVGTAWAGDNVAGVCRRTDSQGKRMVMGIDRPGRNGVQWANTAGWIWDLDIIEATSGLTECGGFELIAGAAVDTGLYSGPGLSTPRIGTAWAGELLFLYCKVIDNQGRRLVLGTHVNGRNGVQWAQTAGYIWDLDLAQNTGNLPFCGVE